MSKQNKKGAGREGYAAQYKASRTWEKNRLKRLARTLKRQPNNKQIEPAMKGLVYRRKAPVTPFWSHSMIAIAKLFKEFGGSFDKDIFSPDEKKRGIALAMHSKYAKLPTSKKKTAHSNVSMFSIEARLVNGRQGISWSS